MENSHQRATWRPSRHGLQLASSSQIGAGDRISASITLRMCTCDCKAKQIPPPTLDRNRANDLGTRADRLRALQSTRQAPIVGAAQELPALKAAMVQDLLHQIIADFPAVQHAFGYGSGVFHQPDLYESAPVGPDGLTHTGGRPDGPQLDFVFVVEDPLEWHHQNIARHRTHYSFVATLGPSAVTAVAERLGVGIYFNTLVPWANHRIKYGVISLGALTHDLLHWNSLYCAGRLHKPVLPLRTDPRVEAAQAANLLAALRVALLLLPERFSTDELLHTICALSYSGDLRVGLAEDSKKVHRIVQGSNSGLRELYAGPLQTAEVQWRVVQWLGLAQHAQQQQQQAQGQEEAGGSWEQDRSANAQAALLSALPRTLLQHMARSAGLPDPQGLLRLPEGSWELAAALLAPEQRHPPSWHVRHAVSAIVRGSSHRQLLAGLLSAGLAKSVRYSLSKLRKAWR